MSGIVKTKLTNEQLITLARVRLEHPRCSTCSQYNRDRMYGRGRCEVTNFLMNEDEYCRYHSELAMLDRAIDAGEVKA